MDCLHFYDKNDFTSWINFDILSLLIGFEQLLSKSKDNPCSHLKKWALFYKT